MKIVDETNNRILNDNVFKDSDRSIVVSALTIISIFLSSFFGETFEYFEYIFIGNYRILFLIGLLIFLAVICIVNNKNINKKVITSKGNLVVTKTFSDFVPNLICITAYCLYETIEYTVYYEYYYMLYLGIVLMALSVLTAIAILLFRPKTHSNKKMVLKYVFALLIPNEIMRSYVVEELFAEIEWEIGYLTIFVFALMLLVSFGIYLVINILSIKKQKNFEK